MRSSWIPNTLLGFYSNFSYTTTMDINEDRILKKKELRKQTLEKLKKFTGRKREQAEKELINKLIQSLEWQQSSCVALTIALPFEINTTFLIHHAWKEKKQVVVPVIQKNNQMEFHTISPNTKWKDSSFQTSEPIGEYAIPKEKINFILVPGIVYHEDGYRIGFGKGFYDQYLTNFHGETASLAFSWQINNHWQPEIFDQKVQKIHTSDI
jgi:5-formyltetrahydrofolate cyclo-ligase